jgi:ABC-type glutathione transport system ATPase component
MISSPALDTRTLHSAEPLLRVRRLCKHFPVYGKGFIKKQVGVVKAADDVSFDLMEGETLGLVGESGCGKTTTGPVDSACDYAHVRESPFQDNT